MAAANTDLLRKWSRKWVGQIGSGGVSDAVVTTIPLASTTNLPTDTAVTLVIDRVDSAGTKTPSLEETIIGVVSGSNIVNAVRGEEGTAQAHNAGAVVELLVTSSEHNDLVDHLLVGHLQDGRHAGSAITASNIAASAITAGNIGASAITAGTIAASAVIEGNIGFSLVTASSTDTFTNKTLTAPKIVNGGFIADANGNEQIIFNTTASAVNELTITNAATGGNPIIEATGETNVHLVARAKGNGLLKTSVLRQDNTTNSYKHNTVILSGWGFVAGSGATTTTDTVTFGITFSSAPIVITTKLGYKDGSDPTSIGDFSNISANGFNDVTVPNSSTTGFTANINSIDAQGATVRYGYSWIAIGEL